MTKFYLTQNSTKILKTHGKGFAFEPLQQFAGSIPGVLALETEADQKAMDYEVLNPSSGVTEITQKEWEDLTKKNWGAPNTSTSEVSKDRLPPLPIKLTPSKSPALLVEDPSTHRSDSPEITGPTTRKGIDDVLNVDTVTPAPSQVSNAPRRGRKPKADAKG